MEKRILKQRISFFRTVAVFSILMVVSVGWIALDSWMHITDTGGVHSVCIPDFCGEAIEDLAFEDWQEISISYRHDDTVPAGVVFSQSPSAGSLRKLSDQKTHCRIDLVVSLGREYVILPQVIGKDIRAVMQQLQELGLVVKTVKEPSPAAEGEILFVSPTAGTEIPRGTTVTLTVSAGVPTETLEVPDTRGLSRADALVRLWLAGLEVSDVIEEVSDAPAGTVIRQSHRAGTVVRTGTKIKLFISKEDTQE